MFPKPILLILTDGGAKDTSVKRIENSCNMATVTTLEQITEENSGLDQGGLEQLGNDHPKLRAFQTAVRAALQKRIRHV